jgi:hypothetical protein
MATIRDIVIDCADPASLGAFWAGVLDGYRVHPWTDEELARLAALGIDAAEDPTVRLSGPGTRMFFQLVPEPKVAKNRLHFDLATPDADAEAARIVGLGGRVVAEYEWWITMADPEGNEFCVMRQPPAVSSSM